ncbi:bifunctional phosphoribosyl-AMP cyclohydrolase/phosphoribosyl-ATP diphosphatase HisIE [uncultured Sanguibacteroides sp.]|uniref:bifunctional phosphoribosyl-AMP cyclohydrolase/phosphoribosyl-ATP diphosphatase HisIE n=1 Tax=uncultured Sanguibacteroides sp. TaxID=1635151 RepID=UPI0025F9B12B|nr:bifunctional phosphoribosyl-AMP cyclohydrolase/phosphoribosyl-ATP diphosphatase HisIE [uncultured Sanguibacteroides sp.]
MLDIGRLKFDKSGLIPAIIQDVNTRVVLMQGYMDEISVRRSLETGKVCFFSRSRQCLWTKGEESGHFLYLQDILVDCDGDSLLVKVKPEGPTCHTGQDTCWGEENGSDNFLLYLEHFLQKRKNDSPEDSYTAKLISKGINKVAQKVGEEAVELVIEAKDENRELFLNEAADLLYHYLVLLMAKGYELEDVINVLKKRHK